MKDIKRQQPSSACRGLLTISIHNRKMQAARALRTSTGSQKAEVTHGERMGGSRQAEGSETRVALAHTLSPSSSWRSSVAGSGRAGQGAAGGSPKGSTQRHQPTRRPEQDAPLAVHSREFLEAGDNPPWPSPPRAALSPAGVIGLKSNLAYMDSRMGNLVGPRHRRSGRPSAAAALVARSLRVVCACTPTSPHKRSALMLHAGDPS